MNDETAVNLRHIQLGKIFRLFVQYNEIVDALEDSTLVHATAKINGRNGIVISCGENERYIANSAEDYKLFKQKVSDMDDKLLKAEERKKKEELIFKKLDTFERRVIRCHGMVVNELRERFNEEEKIIFDEIVERYSAG